MRQKNLIVEKESEIVPAVKPFKEKKYTLKEAAEEIEKSYSTARRLFMNECGRFSCGADGVIFPGTKPKPHGKRRRMTYDITQSDVDRVNRKMRGQTE